MKLPDSAGGWVGLCLGIASLLGLIGTMGTHLWERWEGLATKSYHDEQIKKDLEPLVVPLRNIESQAVVDRIRGLLRSRCANPQRFADDPKLELRLAEQLSRYEELVDREYDEGRCRDGVWYNGAGLPG